MELSKNPMYSTSLNCLRSSSLMVLYPESIPEAFFTFSKKPMPNKRIPTNIEMIKSTILSYIFKL